MRSLVNIILVGCLAPFALLVGSAGLTLKPWPDFMPNLEPGKSNPPVAASLPANTEITPAGAEVPAARITWFGRWSGWAYANRARDTRLAVEKITTDGAVITYSFASRQVKPFITRAEANFISHELQGDIGGPTCDVPNAPIWRYRVSVDPGAGLGGRLSLERQMSRAWHTRGLA